jgi:hypothetical protein
MEIPKPKAVRVIGIIVAVFGGLILMSNGLCALIFSVIDFKSLMMRDMPADVPPEMRYFLGIFDMIIPIVALTALLGLGWLIGGIYLRHFRRWAWWMVNIVALLMIVVNWVIPFLIGGMFRNMFPAQEMGAEMMLLARINSYFGAVFFTIPLVMLLYYLNKAKVRNAFM